MNKETVHIILILAFAVGIAVILANMLYLELRTRWIVEPIRIEQTEASREIWKWRSCIVRGGNKSCGSPTDYEKALWWTETEGGEKVETVK